MVPAAVGSDGAGSVRIPAAWTGLVGLKPQRGRISGWPDPDPFFGITCNGPLARSVADAAALLDVLAGRRVGDPAWAVAGEYLEACDRPAGRLRIARFIAPVIADAAVDPEVVRAWDSASDLLASLGHEVVDVPVPLPPEAVPVFETCWAVLTALTVVPPEREPLLRPLTRWLIGRGRAVSGPEFGLAIGAMRRFAAQALTALAPYDAVLTPTLAAPPAPVGALRDDADPERDFENQKRFTPWTSAWNVTGMPAISLPLHWTPSGLPVGVMLAARPAEDELLLSLAAQVEEAVGGFGRRPPGW
jgi:amidase